MLTSNFSRSARHPHAVAISVGVPPWYHGRRYMPLAPDRAWLRLPEAEYRPLYAARLAGLDAHEVVANLGEDAVLLCWESPGEFCHRRLVAEWLERETGIVVPEVSSCRDMATG